MMDILLQLSLVYNPCSSLPSFPSMSSYTHDEDHPLVTVIDFSLPYYP